VASYRKYERGTDNARDFSPSGMADPDQRKSKMVSSTKYEAKKDALITDDRRETISAVKRWSIAPSGRGPKSFDLLTAAVLGMKTVLTEALTFSKMTGIDAQCLEMRPAPERSKSWFYKRIREIMRNILISICKDPDDAFLNRPFWLIYEVWSSTNNNKFSLALM